MELDDAVAALGALAQETRLKIFRLLVLSGPAGVAAGKIAQGLGIPNNTLSFHLAILANAGLVTSRKEGRSILYAIDLEGTQALLGFLVEDCCGGRTELCAPLAELARVRRCSTDEVGDFDDKQ